MMIDPRESDSGLFVSLEHPEALSEPEKLLAAYFNSPNVGLCIFDSELRYFAINRTLAEINGVPVEAHLGKTLREVLGDFADSLESKFHQALEAKKPINFEVSGRLPSRTETGHWIVHYLPIRDHNHHVARVGAVVLDITAQKELEQSLQTICGQLRLETGRLRVLSDVSKLLSSNWDVPQVFPKISARIRRVLRQEFAGFALHDEGSGLLVDQATDFPLSKGLMPRVQLSSSHTPPGQAMQRREAMIFTKVEIAGPQ
jgi:PAS domain S-box-containing protein